jgi:phosphatidylcholine synthase
MLKFRALMVHILTASGLVPIFLAMQAMWQDDVYQTLMWLAVAVLIDGLDGPLARRFEVRRHWPQIDGAILDHIIDYLSYCFIPALMLVHFNLLPVFWAMPVAAFICMASLYTFANKNLKTAENDFRGFPALWNLAVFYMVILNTSPDINLWVVIILGAMVYAPIRVVHPVRVEAMRWVTLPLVLIWLGLIFAYLIRAEAGLPPLGDAVFTALSLYLLGLSIWRSYLLRGR